MKLHVTNLGQIMTAEIRIAPLTIFFGKSGTQKTWTAHAYFKLLENFRVAGTSPSIAYPPSVEERAHALATGWMELVRESPTSDVSLEISRDEVLEPLHDALSVQLGGRAFRSALGVALPDNASVALEIPRDELAKGVGLELRITVSADRKRFEREVRFHNGREPWRSTSYPKDDGEIESSLQDAVRVLVLAWRYQVRALPAERVNLVQVFLAMLRAKDAPMPRALVDFCYLMGIAASTGVAAPTSGSLADGLGNVVGGNFLFREGQLLFRHRSAPEGEELPISAAASLAKSLAGLGAFLANAGPGDVLIIDEPEMNAHPEAQVALVELFAAMIRSGMHVLLITHSPYIVDHVSALIEAARVTPEDRAAVRTKIGLAGEDVWLMPEEVAVYDFQGPTVRQVFNRETGSIDWSTFTNVNGRESELMRALVAREKDDA